MFIIKVGYGVTPRPYPIFSRICWLFSFLVFLLNFGKCRINISPFPKEHVRMHDSLASNHERGRSGMVWELKIVYEEEN